MQCNVMQCNVMEQSEGMPIKGKLYVTNLMSQPSPFVSSVSACFNVMSILWNVCNGHVFHISFFVVKIFTAHPTPPTTGWSWARPEPGMRPARRAPVQKEHCSSARVIKRLLKLHNFSRARHSVHKVLDEFMIEILNNGVLHFLSKKQTSFMWKIQHHF